MTCPINRTIKKRPKGRLAYKMGGYFMYTFDDYKRALEGAGPKFKELALDKAAHDPNISLFDLRRLVDIADPDCM